MTWAKNDVTTLSVASQISSAHVVYWNTFQGLVEQISVRRMKCSCLGLTDVFGRGAAWVSVVCLAIDLSSVTVESLNGRFVESRVLRLLLC